LIRPLNRLSAPELQAGDADKPVPVDLTVPRLARQASIELLNVFRDDFVPDGVLTFYDL